MNYPFLLGTRHIPAVTQTSGAKESVILHVVEVELTRGRAAAGWSVLLSAAGSASRPDTQPDISTCAAMKSVGLAGLIFGTGTRRAMAAGGC